MKNNQENNNYQGSSIFNKLVLSFFLIILSIGISINYFLQKYLGVILVNNNIEKEVVVEVMISFVKTGTIITLLFTFVSIVVSFFVSKSLIRPITKLKQAVSEVGKGNLNYNIQIDSDDETGELAEIFNKMINDLRDLQADSVKHSEKLERQVSEKTKTLRTTLDKMNEDKGELEHQRVATLNILEDVQESQEALEKSKESLEQRQFELESLKSLSDSLTSVIDMDELVILVQKYLDQITNASVVTIMISNPAEAGDLYYKSLLKEAVSEKYIGIIREEISKYAKKNSDYFDDSYIGLLDKIRPSLVGAGLDNGKAEFPFKTLLTPLSTGGKTFGALHFCYSEDNESEHKQESNLLHALSSTISISIARLHALDQYQHSRTESLVKSLNDGVIMYTNEKSIALTNPKATEYTGLSYSLNTLDDFIKLFESIEVEAAINSTLGEGKVTIIKEASLMNKFYEMIIYPVKDNEQEIVGGAIIIHDITYRREIDQMKTEFVSVASHQLRTPLTAIKLFTDMLVRGEVGELNKEQKEYLDNVYNSTERMVRLVNDLLNVTRIESGRLIVSPQPTDINDFIKNVIMEITPTAQMKKAVINFSDVDLPKVNLDQNLFRQVIQNLISNAVRYSKSDGGVVNVKVERQDEEFLMTVSDNGIGIPVEMQKRIFEKFYRADNAIKAVTEGTGLGLYVSKMVVENSGGKVWFDSKEDAGTSFFVRMPLKGMDAKEGERGLSIS